jgi:hypothetical protein
MQSSPASCCFLHLRYKYSPQHPVLYGCETWSLTVRVDVWDVTYSGKAPKVRLGCTAGCQTAQNAPSSKVTEQDNLFLVSKFQLQFST